MRAGSGRPYAEFLVWLLPDLDRIRQLGISLRRDGHVEADPGRGFLLVFVRRLRDRPVATDRFDDRHGDILALVIAQCDLVRRPIETVSYTHLTLPTSDLV